MKASLLESATVFCISSNGVVEGHHFLTLTTCHATPPSRRNMERRSRTFSLPPSFDRIYVGNEDGGEKEFVKLSRSARSLSEDFLRTSRQQRQGLLRNICCVSGGIEIETRVGGRKIDISKSKRKVTHGNVSGRVIKINATSKSKRKSLVCRPKKEKGSSCSAISVKMDGYMLSYFITALRKSQTFRSLFIDHWSKGERSGSKREGYPLLVFVALMMQPKYEVLDLLGNKMVNSNILFRRSLEHALSWLSTLGGAFSALGDLSPSWAEEAGHVSLTQLRIALKLGDPGIQSRCRLYAAISLLQRGYMKSCRDIVKKEYQYATSLPEGSDPRLRRMCLGVWSKLQYHWNQVAKSDKRMLKSTLEDGLQNIRNNAKYWNVYDLEEGRKIAVEESKLS